MKKLFLLFAVVALFASCSKERKFVVEAKIEGFPAMEVFLKKLVDEKPMTIDSVKVDSTGIFTLKGKSENTELYYLVDEMNRPILQFFIDPGDKIKIEGNINDLANIKITGSKTQTEYNEYQTMVLPVTQQQQALYQEYMQAQMIPDSIERDAKSKEINAQWEALVDSSTDAMIQFIANHNKSVASAYLIQTELLNSGETKVIDSVLNLLDKSLNNNIYIVNTKQKLDILKSVEIGQPIPEINLPDTANVNVALSSLKGQYVLVDFWAGWCRPCIEEMPSLIKAFNMYKNNGFTIYGVSLDRDRDTWVSTIKKFDMQWINVSDLQYWDSPYIKTFGISYIPSNFLVDKNGIIIAKNLRGEDLMKKLAEIFPEVNNATASK